MDLVFRSIDFNKIHGDDGKFFICCGSTLNKSPGKKVPLSEGMGISTYLLVNLKGKEKVDNLFTNSLSLEGKCFCFF